MRAMATPKFGGSELFEERDDIERPVPGPGQVLVRVLATATNPMIPSYGPTAPSPVSNRR